MLIVCIECYIRPFVQQYPHSSSSPYHSANNAYRIACYIPPFIQQYSADFSCLLLLTLPHSDSFTTTRCAILPPHYLYNNPTCHSYPSPPSAVIQQSARLLQVPPPPHSYSSALHTSHLLLVTSPQHCQRPSYCMLHLPIRTAVLSVQPTRNIPSTSSPHSYSSALLNCHTHITTMLPSQSFSCHTVLPSRVHHPFTHPLDLRPSHSPAMSRL